MWHFTAIFAKNARIEQISDCGYLSPCILGDLFSYFEENGYTSVSLPIVRIGPSIYSCSEQRWKRVRNRHLSLLDRFVLAVLVVFSKLIYICEHQQYENEIWDRHLSLMRKHEEEERKEREATLAREKERAYYQEIRRAQEQEEAKRAEKERLAIAKAKSDRVARIEACNETNWEQDPEDPLLFSFRDGRDRIKFGLAYTNVVPYGNLPAKQVYNARICRWETIGRQEGAKRGIYLVSPTAKKSVSYVIVVDPLTLPGSNGEDLVLFITDYGGHVYRLWNPIRRECYSNLTDEQFRDRELVAKLEKIELFLTQLYKRTVSLGGSGASWV
jgi:hypothetical protein